MAEPPSYEESTSGAGKPSDHKGDSKTHPKSSIKDQIDVFRIQHVASIVPKIMAHISERARQGLSKTTIVLIPSDQDASRNGTMVDFPDGEVPIVVQFEDQQNSTQFWLQEKVLPELREQLHQAVMAGVPAQSAPVYLEERPPLPLKKSSWLFGRNGSKAPEVLPRVQLPKSYPVTVELDDVHFRFETEFGLYTTKPARVVLVMVDVR